MQSLYRSLLIYRTYISVPRNLFFFAILPLLVVAYVSGFVFFDRIKSEASVASSSMNTVVYKSTNPQTNANLLTPYSSEVKSASDKYGFTSSSDLFRASNEPTTGLVPIYRLYNPKSGDFMVTQWPKEVEGAVNRYSYQDEGISFYASRVNRENMTPLYKFVKGSFHNYAVSRDEVRRLESSGWTNEGVAFYVRPLEARQTDPTTPVVPSPTPVTTTPPAASNDQPKPTPNTDYSQYGSYVNWGDIAKPGENINQVLQKPEVKNKILKLPTGIFEVSNFLDPYAAIKVPSDVRGVVGSGRDTIIRIKPNTSTYEHTVPAQSQGGTNQLYIMRINDGAQPQLLANLWIQGTEQGHLYNGVMVGKSQPGTTVQDILVTGIPGDYHENPGETFGVTFWRGSRSITRGIEVDGRRVTGDNYEQRKFGASVGASGLSFSMHDYAKVYDSYIHDHRYGMPTFWKSQHGQTWNLQSIRNRIGINHEYSFNAVHHQPVMHSSHTRRHVNFLANDRDGALTIIGATNDEWINTAASGPIGKGKNMLVLTSNDYRSKNDNTIVTPPRILLDDGKTKAPYVWAH